MTKLIALVVYVSVGMQQSSAGAKLSDATPLEDYYDEPQPDRPAHPHKVAKPHHKHHQAAATAHHKGLSQHHQAAVTAHHKGLSQHHQAAVTAHHKGLSQHHQAAVTAKGLAQHHQAAVTAHHRRTPPAHAHTAQAHTGKVHTVANPAYHHAATQLKHAPVKPNATLMKNLTSLMLKAETGKRVEPDVFDEVIGSIRGQMVTQLQGHVNDIGTDLQLKVDAISTCFTDHAFSSTGPPTAAPTPAPTPQQLKNAGQNCWESCGKSHGRCDWCGSMGSCCRRDGPLGLLRWRGDSCDGSIGGQGRNECVMTPTQFRTPTPTPPPTPSPPAAGPSAGYDVADEAHTAAVGEYNSAVQTEQTDCGARDTTCGTRDSNGLALYNTVRGSMECDLETPPPDTIAYDDSFVLATVTDWTGNIDTMHTQWQTSADLCSTAETVCAQAETTTAEKDTAKAEACASMEAAGVAGASAYDDCYNVAKGEFDASVNFGEDIATQKELVLQLETLICYIKVAMKTINDPDIPSRTDGSIACGDAGADYECTCTSNDGQEYQQMYNLEVTVPVEPTRDTEWDDKGCEDNVE